MNELFKILAIGEEGKQITSLIAGNFVDYKIQCQLASYRLSLADLAFRLRDEVGLNFHSGMNHIHDYLHPSMSAAAFDEWWIFSAKPIHWVVVALIAKELEAKDAE